MNTVITIASTTMYVRVDASWLLVSLAVLAVIVLNILMLAFALRLRRYFHSLGERNEEE